MFVAIIFYPIRHADIWTHWYLSWSHHRLVLPSMQFDAVGSAFIQGYYDSWYLTSDKVHGKNLCSFLRLLYWELYKRWFMRALTERSIAGIVNTITSDEKCVLQHNEMTAKSYHHRGLRLGLEIPYYLPLTSCGQKIRFLLDVACWCILLYGFKDAVG